MYIYWSYTAHTLQEQNVISIYLFHFISFYSWFKNLIFYVFIYLQAMLFYYIIISMLMIKHLSDLCDYRIWTKVETCHIDS